MQSLVPASGRPQSLHAYPLHPQASHVPLSPAPKLQKASIAQGLLVEQQEPTVPELSTTVPEPSVSPEQDSHIPSSDTQLSSSTLAALL
jgi:hypothetical protein